MLPLKSSEPGICRFVSCEPSPAKKAAVTVPAKPASPEAAVTVALPAPTLTSPPIDVSPVIAAVEPTASEVPAVTEVTVVTALAETSPVTEALSCTVKAPLERVVPSTTTVEPNVAAAATSNVL